MGLLRPERAGPGCGLPKGIEPTRLGGDANGHAGNPAMAGNSAIALIRGGRTRAPVLVRGEISGSSAERLGVHKTAVIRVTSGSTARRTRRPTLNGRGRPVVSGLCGDVPAIGKSVARQARRYESYPQTRRRFGMSTAAANASTRTTRAPPTARRSHWGLRQRRQPDVAPAAVNRDYPDSEQTTFSDCHSTSTYLIAGPHTQSGPTSRGDAGLLCVLIANPATTSGCCRRYRSTVRPVRHRRWNHPLHRDTIPIGQP